MNRIKRPFTISAFSVIFTDIFLMLCGITAGFAFILAFSLFCLAAILKKFCFGKHILLFLVFSMLSFSLFSVSYMYSSKATKISGYNISVSGTVTDFPGKTSSDSSLIVIKNPEVSGVKLNCKIAVYSQNGISVCPGDKISFTADSISFENNNEGIYKFHTLSNKIYLSAFSYDNDIFVTEKYNGNNILYKIPVLRKALTDKLFSNMSEENAAITVALITGDKSYISNEIDTAIKIGGVSHIFAVSGMHLTLWTSIFFIIFRRKARVSIPVNITAILFVLFYIAFTGFSPSVIRAGIMLIMIFISKIIKRSSDTMNSWGLAGTLMILFNPFLAGNVSFLLSYIATFALIFLANYVMKPKSSVRKINGKIKIEIPKINLLTGIAVTVGVILMTIPVSALFFGSVSLLAPFSSVIITPLAELIMITSAVSIIFPSGCRLSSAIFSLNSLLGDLMTKILSSANSFELSVLPINKYIVIIWFTASALTVAFVVLFFKKRKKTLFTILICTCILLGISLTDSILHYNNTTVYIPRGENSTALAFSFPGKKSLLYGTGGTFAVRSDITSFFGSQGEYYIDDIIVPRNNKTENSNTDYFKRQFSPDTVFRFAEKAGTQYFSKSINENTNIRVEYSDNFSAAIIYSGKTKIVICSLPTSNFSAKSIEYQSGDILICRSKIPNSLDTKNFSSVIVMTDKELHNLPSDTLSTKDKSIKIEIKGDSYALN